MMRWSAPLSLSLALLLGCGSPLVGAECRSDHILCDGVCVDPSRDPDNCGGCGMSCGVFECSASECTDDIRPDALLDGGLLPDGAMPADTGDDGGVNLIPGRDPPGTTPVGASFPDDTVQDGCNLGETQCGGGCANLQKSRDHCGACGTPCRADQYCAEGMCVDRCEDPLHLCGGECVLLDSDPDNCGQCDNECRSGLCEMGVCADVVSGHLVVVGHDYTSGRTETMQRMAGNALFLARGAPVRALVYRGESTDASVSGVERAIDRVVELDGRTWEQTEAVPDDLPAQLLGASALIVHAQHGASDSELETLGQRWGLSLSQFLLRGGVIVLFETMSSDNDGTYQLLEPAGLFSADAREQVSSNRLEVVSPGVGVAARATRNYTAADVTVRFLGDAIPGAAIVIDEDGEPVVVHRVVSP